jgi:hypothetical protein
LVRMPDIKLPQMPLPPTPLWIYNCSDVQNINLLKCRVF